MPRSRTGANRPVLLALALLWCLCVPGSVVANEAPPGAVAAPTSTGAPLLDARLVLGQSRELLMSGKNDEAVDLLRRAIAQGSHDVALERDLRLQLIKTYVLWSNAIQDEPQMLEPSKALAARAAECARDLLDVPALRHTRLEPREEYPDRMHDIFREVRSEKFGSIRIGSILPASATVRLDSVSLARNEAGEILAEDVPAGPHRIVVEAAGHVTRTDLLLLPAGRELVRDYQLQKSRGPRWYASRLAVVAGIAVAFALGRDDNGSPAAAEPLSASPPPPPAP